MQESFQQQLQFEYCLWCLGQKGQLLMYLENENKNVFWKKYKKSDLYFTGTCWVLMGTFQQRGHRRLPGQHLLHPPSWSPGGERRVPHASMDMVPLVSLGPFLLNLAVRSCWRSPGMKALPAPHLHLCNYLFGWQAYEPFSRAWDWSVPHSPVQHHVLPNCSISVVGRIERCRKKATKLI